MEKIFAGLLMLSSLSAYADLGPKIYKFEINESSEKNSIEINTTIGKVTVIESSKEKEKSTCKIKTESPLIKQELNIINQLGDKISAEIYPISIKNDEVELMLTYSRVEYTSLTKGKEQIKINDDCLFNNKSYVSENTYTQWYGKVKLNEDVKIPLSNNENLLLKIQESSIMENIVAKKD